MSTQDSTLTKQLFPLNDLSAYHDEILEKVMSTGKTDSSTNTDIDDLITFNGYYALDNTSGHFFTVDTNMCVTTKNSVASATYDVSFIIHIFEGVAIRVPFTGQFKKQPDGSYKLTQTANGVGGLNEVDLDITFTRSKSKDKTTASLSGTITTRAPGTPAVSISGSTYNNPIPYSMYEGLYHNEDGKTTPYPTANIGKNFLLEYNFEDKKAPLTTIENYTYNLNMYYFSFKQPSSSSNSSASKLDLRFALIMGTSPSAGMVSNNMTVLDGFTIGTRSLQTVTTCNTIGTSTDYNANSKALAELSGYYPLKATSSTDTGTDSIKDGAFIAIEGDYYTGGTEATTVYKVTIGICTDGETTDTYIIDSSMSFENNVLRIPAKSDDPSDAPILEMTFTKGYERSTQSPSLSGSLVSISGSIRGVSAEGATALNPVPLSAFAGTPMTNKQGDRITVNSDYEVTIAGKVYTDFIYVPLMYILAAAETLIEGADTKTTETLLSLGTNSVQGNTCITTVQHYENKTPVGLPNIYFVSALPPQKTPSTTSNTESKETEVA